MTRREPASSDDDVPEFIEEFACVVCARTGHAVWQNQSGAARTLIEMAGGFTLRPDDDNPAIAIIVCGHCGAAQQAKLSPSNTAH